MNFPMMALYYSRNISSSFNARYSISQCSVIVFHSFGLLSRYSVASDLTDRINLNRHQTGKVAGTRMHE